MHRLALLAAIAVPAAAFGVQQQQNRTGFVVHQLQVCAQEHNADFNRFTDDVVAPIIEELKNQGMIRSWSHLVHAWGDEWNHSWLTVTDSHQAFLTYWSEFLRRLNAARPNWATETAAWCSMHKDNMYTMRNSR